VYEFAQRKASVAIASSTVNNLLPTKRDTSPVLCLKAGLWAHECQLMTPAAVLNKEHNGCYQALQTT